MFPRLRELAQTCGVFTTLEPNIFKTYVFASLIDHPHRSLPPLPYPMYTLAMQGCVVTSTGFEKEAKTAIQKRVEMMGGIYANAFTDQGTNGVVTR